MSYRSPTNWKPGDLPRSNSMGIWRPSPADAHGGGARSRRDASSWARTRTAAGAAVEGDAHAAAVPGPSGPVAAGHLLAGGRPTSTSSCSSCRLTPRAAGRSALADPRPDRRLLRDAQPQRPRLDQDVLGAGPKATRASQRRRRRPSTRRSPPLDPGGRQQPRPAQRIEAQPGSPQARDGSVTDDEIVRVPSRFTRGNGKRQTKRQLVRTVRKASGCRA